MPKFKKYRRFGGTGRKNSGILRIHYTLAGSPVASWPLAGKTPLSDVSLQKQKENQYFNNRGDGSGLLLQRLFLKKVCAFCDILNILPYLVQVSNKMQYCFQNIQPSLVSGNGTTTTITTTP